MKARPIIFDTDPGIDDAAAIVIAIKDPDLDVKLLSTVGANVEVEKTCMNALRLTEFMDVDIPVAKGCGEPLMRKLRPCPEVHGVTGMDGYDFPPVTRKPLDKHAVVAMRDIIMSSEEKITLVVIGTHTNVAIMLKMYPEVKEKIEEIVTMGGALAGGNTNSTAEFNIYNDPHAADIVFKSGIPITMLGLNVTNYALIYRKEAEAIKARGGKAGEMICSLLEHYRSGSLDAGVRVHDAVAVAYMVRPDLFKTEMMPVEIALDGPAAGTTVSDFRAMESGEKKPNVKVVTEVDQEGYTQWFVDEFCRGEE
ncbi:MAG: ribonucleoside hydrolase RihC [Clostridia bacterium]|nr:ribonucleoside hydrolase RihC [Clostridia bacterium]